MFTKISVFTKEIHIITSENILSVWVRVVEFWVQIDWIYYTDVIMYNIDASLWLRLLTEWFHILKNIGMACQSKTPPLSALFDWYNITQLCNVIKNQNQNVMASQEFNTKKLHLECEREQAFSSLKNVMNLEKLFFIVFICNCTAFEKLYNYTWTWWKIIYQDS